MRLAITAGGTGGHIFPALSLAEELLRRGHDVIFITDRRFEQYGCPLSEGTQLHILDIRNPAGGVPAKIRGVWGILLAAISVRRMLRIQRVEVVVGFGGYPSVPAVMAASMLRRTKLVLHEQNALPGRANRFFSRFADKVALSLPGTDSARMHRACFSSSLDDKLIYTGNPVRSEIVALAQEEYIPPERDVHLLVLGGSQGAAVFSQLLPDAVGLLPEDLRARLVITSQCRAELIEQTQQKYDAAGVRATLRNFFSDMVQLLGDAHMVIARAGASTIAEVLVAGRPSLLIPYPHAKDDHQTQNAIAARDAGACVICQERDTSAEQLADILCDILTDSGKLKDMSAAARAISSPDATSKLADIL